MAEFTTSVPIGTEGRPLYQVTVNDGGEDGGSTSRILVSGFPPSSDLTASDNAVQALADAFAEAAGYHVVNVSRINSIETSL